MAFLSLCACLAVYTRGRRVRYRARYLQTLEPAGGSLLRQYSLGNHAKPTATGGLFDDRGVDVSAPGSEDLPSEIDISPDYDALVREMQRIKQEIRAVHSKRTVDHGAPEPTTTTAVARTIDDSVEAELRREIAVMRGELAGLRAETDELRDLPPAYH